MSLPLAAILLLLVFGTLLAVMLPLGVGMLAVVGGVAATFALSHATDVSQYALNIVTLIGLLGTITGLIHSFGAVAHAPPETRAQLLSAGISEAMWNTALGLGIAVLCMIFHLYLHSAAKKIKQDMELSTMKLENLLLNKGQR